jgi:bacteriorhodopsin
VFWNILLAVLIGGLTIFIAALGGQLASTKPLHKWAFWGPGAVMLLLIFIQTVRNERSQDKLQGQVEGG